ncbi:MAG: MFS transporter [Dehalococcoidia bacterium]|nr:MFS transporter [Dehalococcoidia bacterium]
MHYKWRALIAVCFGTYMATMDFSIVNVALPRLSREFDEPADTVVWVTLTSSLVVTGLTLTAGRAGDLFGRKRLYVLGWLIFTAGMAAAGLAQGVEQLIAFRFIQSIGVALAIANGNAIVTAAFPDSERGRALGMTGAVVGAGLMSGPILGGALLSLFGWQAIFYMRVPIGLIALAMALLLIRGDRPPEAGERRLDIPGAITIFLTLGASLLAVNRGREFGWMSPTILGLFALSLASFVAFIRIESRAPSPVLALTLFKHRSFSIGVLSLAINFVGQSAVTFLMPFYLINVRDFSAAHTGLIVSTVPLMMLLLSPVSGYISDRWAFRLQPSLGILLVALGLVALSSVEASTPVTMIVLRLAVVGIGTSVFMSPNSSQIMGSVPRTMLGTASASVATARNVGNATGLALGSAILTAVASASTGLRGVKVDDLPEGAVLDGVQAAFLVAGIASALALVPSLLRGRRQAEGLTLEAVAASEPQRVR